MSRTATLMMTALTACAGLLLASCGQEEKTEGSFKAVADAPAGSDKAAGDASMTRSDDKTVVAVNLTGLTADAEYMAHVHNKPCSEDSGGKHYQYEPGGSEVPPNEIHLSLKADADGKASATTESARKAGPEAVSVVVHYQDKKMLCADL